MTRLDLITLGQIEAASPCAEGWRDLLKGLGYEHGKPDLKRVVSFGDIAATNNAADALWATRCLPHTLDARRFMISLLLPSLRRALTHTTDSRVHGVVADLARWVAGDDAVDLEAAAEAAGAAGAAAGAAGAAARAAEAAEEDWEARAAARAAWAAARAAEAAEEDWEARAAERELQRQDIIFLSPRTVVGIVEVAK